MLIYIPVEDLTILFYYIDTSAVQISDSDSDPNFATMCGMTRARDFI